MAIQLLYIQCLISGEKTITKFLNLCPILFIYVNKICSIQFNSLSLSLSLSRSIDRVGRVPIEDVNENKHFHFVTNPNTLAYTIPSLLVIKLNISGENCSGYYNLNCVSAIICSKKNTEAITELSLTLIHT